MKKNTLYLIVISFVLFILTVIGTYALMQKSLFGLMLYIIVVIAFSLVAVFRAIAEANNKSNTGYTR